MLTEGLVSIPSGSPCTYMMRIFASLPRRGWRTRLLETFV